MKRVLVAFVLVMGWVAGVSAQPVPPSWRPPTGCSTGQTITWSGTAWQCGTAGITNSAGANVVTKSNGTNLVASLIMSDAGSVYVTGGTGTLSAVGGVHTYFATNAGFISSTTPGTANRPLTIQGNNLILQGNGATALTISGALIESAVSTKLARGTAANGALEIAGTALSSNFALGTDEHTYIRGGKNTSTVFVGDVNGAVSIGAAGITTTVLGNATVNGSTTLAEVQSTKGVGAAFADLDAGTKANLRARDSTAIATGVGGGILFEGVYTVAGNVIAGAAGIKAMKTNAVDGDYSFDLVLGSRMNGAGIAEVLRLKNDGSSSFAGALSVTGTLSEQRVRGKWITPAAAGGIIADWNPTGFDTATAVEITTTAQFDLTGIVAAGDGHEIELYNSGPNVVWLYHDNTNSLAANRFSLPDQAAWPLEVRDTARLRYRAGTLNRWVLVSRQGNYFPGIDVAGPINQTSNSFTTSGNATVNGSMFVGDANTDTATITAGISGRLRTVSAPPTLSTCGTSTAAGSNLAGKITSVGSPTSCTLTFATAFAVTPACVLTPAGGVSLYLSAQSTTAITVTTVSGVALPNFNYTCFETP